MVCGVWDDLVVCVMLEHLGIYRGLTSIIVWTVTNNPFFSWRNMHVHYSTRHSFINPDWFIGSSSQPFSQRDPIYIIRTRRACNAMQQLHLVNRVLYLRFQVLTVRFRSWIYLACFSGEKDSTHHPIKHLTFEFHGYVWFAFDVPVLEYVQ